MNTHPPFRFVASALIFALVLIGVPTGGLSQNTTAPYDGQTLFRGLLLGAGPVGQVFPEAWEKAWSLGYDPDSPAVQELQQRLMNEIAQQDPAFMTQFADDVQSGDHLRIQRAIGDAGTRLLNQIEQDRLGNPRPVPQEETFIWLVVMVAVAAIVAALVAVVVVMIPVDPGTGTGDKAQGLSGEMYVNLIASRLASSPR
ncbi:MAG: hypothetical protein ABI968_05695 [Acidobacteriota bacterium]